MSENFVRKTLNVEKIGEKETYTLHDLDLVETKDGHVFIRIFKQNAKPDSTDQNAYLYELTNSVRNINKMALVESEQLNNTSMLPLPLVMELQYLPDTVKLTMVGDTTTIYKVNGVAGVFENEKTTYTVPLSGDTLPDITVKRGNKVIDVYKLHQADLHQTNPLHPEYVKGAKEFCDRLGAVEKQVKKLIDPDVLVELVEIPGSDNTVVYIKVNTDQPDDPLNNPTRPACLEDIEIFYQNGEYLEKYTPHWISQMFGKVLKPGTTDQFQNVFYSWYINIQLPQGSPVVVKQNGVIVRSINLPPHTESGDIS